MSSPHESRVPVLVVDEDGGIPAEQLRELGIRPGSHLRVVAVMHDRSSESLAGSLSGVPDLSWEDFERGSDLARSDAASSCG